MCRFCLICNGIHGVGNIFGPYLHGDKIIIFGGTPPTSHQLVKSHTGRATQHSAQYLSNFVRPPFTSPPPYHLGHSLNPPRCGVKQKR